MSDFHVKTLEQAQNLPEVESEFFVVTYTIDPVTHTTIKNLTPRGFYPIGVDLDDILLFRDRDGRAMKVISTENGPAKTPFNW